MDQQSEYDKAVDKWLDDHDPTPKRQRKYLTSRQMRRRELKERPISSLGKTRREALNHLLYGDANEE